LTVNRLEIQMGQAVSTEKLVKDLSNVVTDTEDLLKATAAQTGERIDVIRRRAEESMRAARARIDETGRLVADRAGEVARSVDAQVRGNPWAAIGISAGIGLIIGILIGRR
jgi:ElaB/YqjD/DUF883 family membrane-anchored ribosome-binding protein